MKQLILIALILWQGGMILNSSLLAQPGTPEMSAQLDALFEEWNSTHTPGGVAGILYKGKLVYARAYGMASLEYDVPNTTETVFNIASVTKQITAFSLLLLEQQGKLSIDDEVRKYLPEVPDFGTPITIRHLLTHTSGLRNFQSILSMAGWRTGDAMTNQDLLKFIAKQNELNFPVGSEYLYCNTGFNLATAIVERITGEEYQTWTRQHIFEPLGMDHTSYRENMERIHKHTATSYQGSPQEGFAQPRKYWTYMGNGNVYTTLSDLAKWMHNLHTGELGGPKVLNRLQERGILTNGDTLSYALGIGVGSYRGLRTLQHGGSVGGYRSSFVYYPTEQTGMIVLSNFSSANPGGKTRSMADIFLAPHFPDPKPQPRPSLKIERTAVEISPDIYQELAGTYWINEGYTLTIFQQGDQWLAEAGGNTFTLQAASDTTFFAKEVPYSMFARRTPGKSVERITLFAPNREYGQRTDPTINTPENLQAFVGAYYSPELETYYHVYLKEGKLMVHHTRHDDFPLTLLDAETLVGDAWFFSNVSVERDRKGKVSGLRVSNGRVRNLWFEKVE